MELIVKISPEKADEIIEIVSKFVVERSMASPAILFIESFKPLHNIGSQALYLFEPFAQIFVNEVKYQEFAAMLSEKKYVTKLVDRIEELNSKYIVKLKKEKEIRKKRNKIIRQKRKERIYKFLKKIKQKIKRGGNDEQY